MCIVSIVCFTALCVSRGFFFFFFFNDTATTEIYTLSLHDALPIFGDDDALGGCVLRGFLVELDADVADLARELVDRKSTRLNSSHLVISYAVFCLKKKKDKGALHVWCGERLEHRRGPSLFRRPHAT